ncbi:hypothetical protein C8J55DRAFT_450132 [Lentinula edodes]|uniref:Uncharacterized protein n=1 Tax=Lentinula lateritia TaxID=40482 RepID=A0A9W9DXY5_9AGAR|nr:hypothetical protein C8J55DRAFT_450132 [Lentinula edodes]
MWTLDLTTFTGLAMLIYLHPQNALYISSPSYFMLHYVWQGFDKARCYFTS